MSSWGRRWGKLIAELIRSECKRLSSLSPREKRVALNCASENVRRSISPEFDTLECFERDDRSSRVSARWRGNYERRFYIRIGWDSRKKKRNISSTITTCWNACRTGADIGVSRVKVQCEKEADGFHKLDTCITVISPRDWKPLPRSHASAISLSVGN